MSLPELLTLGGFVTAFTALFIAGYLRQPTEADQEAYIMNWGILLKQVLPLALQFVPGLPPQVATSIIGTALSVEGLPGKTGAQKKAIVMDAAVTQLQNINTLKGHDVVDIDSIATALSTSIDAGVAATNAIHQAHVGPTPQAAGNGSSALPSTPPPAPTV